MGSVAALFQQGGFLKNNAGSIVSVIEAASKISGGIMASKQAKKNAELLELQGEQEEARSRREAKKAKGRAQARFAKAGVSGGTPLDVALEAEEQYLLEGRRRRMALESEADIQRKAGTIAVIQGLFGAGSTLLGAVRSQAATRPPSPLNSSRTIRLPATGGPTGGFRNIA